MGFLQRFFSLKSIGSKKKQNQKQQKQDERQEQKGRRQLVLNTNEELQVMDQEHEADIGRLLRSSSARYAVVSELDYASFPPLPHPINNVIQTPAASTVSLTSSNISHRGTYNVQVHKRKRHTSTEFPYANRHLDDLKVAQRTRGATAPPKEHAHYLGLRTDPSVASLLELYDDRGRLPENLFSNSPPKRPSPEMKQGRAQTRRSGSTLRQLLGASNKEKSDSNADLSESDISWAERFLSEFDSISSHSSLPRTPVTPRGYSADNRSHRASAPINDSTDHDLSMSTVDNPAISSMEVELSIGSNSSVNLDSVVEGNGPYINSASRSQQRASQVFTFLTQQRQSSIRDDANHRLPEVSTMSRSSSARSSTHSQQTCIDTLENSGEPSNIPATPVPRRNDTRIPQYAVQSRRYSSSLNVLAATRIPSPIPDRPRSAASHAGSDRSSYSGDIPENEAIVRTIHQDKEHTNEVKVLMTGPTKVIVTAPTPSGPHVTPSLIPRGSSVPSKKPSSSSVKQRPLLTECSNSASYSSASTKDSFTHISRPYKQRRPRTSSNPSRARAGTSTFRSPERTKHKSDATSKKASFYTHKKENKSALSVKVDIPSTPIRAHSSTSDTRSLFRAIVAPGGCRLPSTPHASPASSSELSPVGRQLMMDVRQQRMKARDCERERSKRRGDRHGSAYVA